MSDSTRRDRRQSRPPGQSRRTHWLGAALGWLLPAREREAILHDLGELYCHRRRHGSRLGADLWYARRLLGYPPRLLRERLSRSSTRTHGPTGFAHTMDQLLQDVRFAARTLRHSPLFVLVAVATLGLGVGVNSTMFTLVNTLLLRPLPVAAPHELVDVYSIDPDVRVPVTTSYLDYVELRDNTRTLRGLAGHQMMSANLTAGGRSGLVYGELVTGNYFDVLGVPAALGRTIGQQDDQSPGAHAVAMLGHGFWRRRFAADPGVLGRTLKLNGIPFTVIGVAPPYFNGMIHALAADVWVPAMMGTEIDPVGIQSDNPSPTGTHRLDRRGSRWLMLKGRLASGASVQQAGDEIAATMARLATEYPVTNHGWRSRVLPAASVRVHPAVDATLAPVAAIMLGMVGLVLLIACTNIANMMLSRAAARRREIAVRIALGASRRRVVIQLLTESTLLAVVGGLAGWLVAYWLTRVLLALQPPIGVQLSLNLAMDGRVLAFTGIAALGSGLLFGLAPALHASRPDLAVTMKEGAHDSPNPKRRIALRDVLVVAQVAVCVVLLAGAALMTRSMSAAQEIDVGFVTDNLAVFELDLDLHDYTPAATQDFYESIVPRLRAVPGVSAVGMGSRLPFAVSLNTNGVYIPGHQASPDDASYQIDAATVDAGYFDALGIRLVQGRGFTAADTGDSQRVAIITDAMAREYWPDGAAIGARFRVDGLDGPAIEIVGVVADYKVRTVGEPPRPYIHYARTQTSPSFASIVVRFAGDPSQTRALLRRELLAIEPELVLITDTTMAGMLGVALFPVRIGASMLAAFGALALVLAAVGLYGVIGYSVSRRTHEIGIRLALGARRGDVLRLVVGQGVRLTLVGLALGTLAAVTLSGTLAALLYGVSALDPIAFAAAALILLLVAGLSNYLPARRAARVDPMGALRD